ncbi:Hypothetical protein SRAE_0000008000 [Strongyloides ratti]|uniref:Uncharacterized protein n=1 Tax=Strongyloides ratti TaxID=34506 RepID=A0A090MRS4_STRRB|nr:Hypothetical protein SRAE_0000008000 [Strongyloides ratti]CEF60948.1 Hypothetical protein SRAE_0000008000 [Strongyloides ratti]
MRFIILVFSFIIGTTANRDYLALNCKPKSSGTCLIFLTPEGKTFKNYFLPCLDGLTYAALAMGTAGYEVDPKKILGQANEDIEENVTQGDYKCFWKKLNDRDIAPKEDVSVILIAEINSFFLPDDYKNKSSVFNAQARFDSLRDFRPVTLCLASSDFKSFGCNGNSSESSEPMTVLSIDFGMADYTRNTEYVIKIINKIIKEEVDQNIMKKITKMLNLTYSDPTNVTVIDDLKKAEEYMAYLKENSLTSPVTFQITRRPMVVTQSFYKPKVLTKSSRRPKTITQSSRKPRVTMRYIRKFIRTTARPTTKRFTNFRTRVTLKPAIKKKEYTRITTTKKLIKTTLRPTTKLYSKSNSEVKPKSKVTQPSRIPVRIRSNFAQND